MRWLCPAAPTCLNPCLQERELPCSRHPPEVSYITKLMTFIVHLRALCPPDLPPAPPESCQSFHV
jgi:hypothetical protein